MTKQTEKKEAYYHWMVTAQVVFTGKTAEDGGAINVNGMLLTSEPCINAHGLAQAQRTIVANMQEKFQNAEMAVVDVVFLNFSNLGLMTQEGFNPEGSVKPGITKAK